MYDFTENFMVHYVEIIYFILQDRRKLKQEKMLIQIWCKLAVNV